MPKRRKVCSPAQGEQSDIDICAELKEFIAQENVKCVKEIRDSNDRRLMAIEESLSFAMDSLKAVSDRQNSADMDIIQLQRETKELRRRLQQMELSEDRRQQEERRTSLIFSGPAIQTLTRREDAANLIRSRVQQHLRHSLDSSQVKAMIRLKNGKVLVDFTTAARGSDRDVLFRTKTKLRGSGLFISESLTPRRQALFADLLQLKKEGIIFSVFTRSGDILVCRSRDCAPIRIVDPEAVRQLAETSAPLRPTQGRAPASERGRLDPVTEREEERSALERGRTPSDLGGVMELETRRSGGAVDSTAPVSCSVPAGADVVAGRGSSSSSLLECARMSPVDLVRLSPPMEAVPSAGAASAADRSVDGGGGRAGARSRSASPGARPSVAPRPATAGGLESPLRVTSEVASPPLPARSAGESGQREVTGRGYQVLPSVEQREGSEGSLSAGSGSGSGEVRPLMDRLCDELKGLKEAVITLIGQQWPPTAGPHTRPQSSAELRDAVLADVRGMLDEELRQLRRELQELSEVRPLMDRLCDELQGLKEAVITLTEQHSPPAAGPHTRPQSSAELRDAVLADARGMLNEELRQLRRELQELSLEVAQMKNQKQLEVDQMKNQKQLEVDQMKNQKQLEAQAAPQLQQLPIPQELFSCGGKAPATTASTIFGSGFSKTTPSTGTVSSTNGGIKLDQAPSGWTGGTTTGTSAAASTGFSFGPTTAPPAQPSTPSFSFRPPTAEGATSTPAKARGENTTEEGPVSSTSGSGAAVSNTTTSSVVTSTPAAGAGAATPNSSFHFKATPFWFAFGGDQGKVVEATPKATFEFGVSSAASSPFKFSFGGDADKSGSAIFGGAAAADTKTTSIFGGSSGNKTTSIFGGASSTETKPASIFGGMPSSETKTTSIFGTPSVFGGKGTDKAVSLFGGATTGDKTSKEDQIFGGSGTDSKPASLFGGFGLASGAQSSPFGSGSPVFGGWPSFGSAASKPASSESGAAAKPPTPANSSAPKAPEPASSGSAPSAPPAAATGSTDAGAAATPVPSAPPAAATGSTDAGAAATPAPTNGPSTETSINDTAQRGLQSPAASDVSKRTSSQFPAASVVTVQKQELSTVKQLKQFTFPPGLAELQVIAILESLQVQTLKELTVSTPPDSTGRWLRLLPPSLRRLDVFGPGVTGEPVTLARPLDHGLVVVIKQAGDDVINQLAKELGPRATKLTMFNCPRVTAGALQRLLSALTGLEDVTLDGSLSGAITDTSLAALHGCSQLRKMQLGQPYVLCTDIPVTAVSRLVVTCRKLEALLFIATGELSQTVLDALVRADLGKRDDGTPRTLWFQVSEAVYDKLIIPSDTGNIKVLRLRDDKSCGSSLKFIFPPGHSDEQLTALLESLQSLEELTVSIPPDSTGRWLRLLPPSLRRLDVYGPGETGEPVTRTRPLDHGLDVVIQQAGDDVINQLAKELGPRVTALHMFNCPRVTGGALQRLLSALTGLEDVTFDGSLPGAITDASLAALHGCSQLRKMQLGEPGILCTDIPVTAVSRLVVTCRKLDWLSLDTTEGLSQRVLDVLVQADLGESDDGKPRTLKLLVEPPVYEKLKKPPPNSSIKVVKAT
ncbi:uncharacterized protein LOC122394155 [Amphibalanus amphitrite]|uniref:uncharacterized protein LOC122394155 n=1 Tax=Amphibalanus amphitrite TaxID=1232801 RepID=UPI001C923FA6|nr:uncharacterized protein LOC122394155 [Amphibalanus amphitrite]